MKVSNFGPSLTVEILEKQLQLSLIDSRITDCATKRICVIQKARELFMLTKAKIKLMVSSLSLFTGFVR